MINEKDKQSLYTFLTVIAGMAVLLVMFLVTVIVFKGVPKSAESIVAVMGAVTGVLGTLVGYGVGQSGKDKAEQRATKAEQQLRAVVGEGGKDVLKQARDAYPELFK
ncbi:MAG: hypothetical protein MI684_04485 [Chlorobiales bacterium]|nr:hypothetical protein [Chlorobiales bacterium]